MKQHKKLYISILFFSILTIGIFLQHTAHFNYPIITFLNNNTQGKALNKEFSTKIKSGNLSTDYVIEEVLQDIEQFGLNTVNIPVIVQINSLSSNDMEIDKASKEKAIKLIKKLKHKKIDVLLEPYPWIQNGELYETDWNPTDINLFFWNWKTKVLKVLVHDIAVPYHVAAINVASNFIHMEYAQGYWCDTIDFVRKQYKGLVTYRTSWWYTASWDKKTVGAYDKKLTNELFSKVDFISVAAYFELTSASENTKDNLVSAIQSTQIYNRNQNIKAELKNFYDTWHKPIFFGELGFPRRNGAATHPWNPNPSEIENSTEQASCFEAYREVFQEEPWLLGFSIFAIGEHGKDKNYYPSKQSTGIIKSWYTK